MKPSGHPLLADRAGLWQQLEPTAHPIEGAPAEVQSW